MAEEFKAARKLAREATRDLLCCHPEDVVNSYIKRINATTREVEISWILAEVRSII